MAGNAVWKVNTSQSMNDLRTYQVCIFSFNSADALIRCAETNSELFATSKVNG